jgi:hypothetical protein
MLRRPRQCQGQSLHHAPTGFPPPALSRHIHLSCRIRLGLLPSELDKEATKQGRDSDKDTEQGWQKEGGDRAQGRSCGAPQEEDLVERSVLSGHMYPGPCFCIGGILQPLEQ